MLGNMDEKRYYKDGEMRKEMKFRLNKSWGILLVGMLVLMVSAYVSAATLFSDNFDDGNSSGWTTQNGSWSVVQDSGSYVFYQSSTSEGRAWVNGSWSNCTVEAKVKVDNFNGSNRAFVCARMKDGNNYYAASLVGGGKLEIRKKVSGSSSTLASKSYSLSTGTWYTVKLEVNGSSIKMYVNGTQQLSATDSSLSSGGAGLIAYKVVAKYDNVVVNDLGGSSTSVPTSTSTSTTSNPSPTPTSTGSNGGNLTITSTIIVKAGTTYDGKGVTIKASGMGDGSQDEGQDPIFKLENGANLKNVVIAAPGCDGIHCYGNNVVENVTWQDVGEDALTVKGEGNVTIKGGSAKYADDKVFQLNAACTFTIQNFTAYDFGKVVRQNGDTTFKCTIYIDSCNFNGNGGECIARTDSKTTQLYYRNMTASGVGTLWKFPSSSQIHTY